MVKRLDPIQYFGPVPGTSTGMQRGEGFANPVQPAAEVPEDDEKTPLKSVPDPEADPAADANNNKAARLPKS